MHLVNPFFPSSCVKGIRSSHLVPSPLSPPIFFLYQLPTASPFGFGPLWLCVLKHPLSLRLPSILSFRIQENCCCLLSFLIFIFSFSTAFLFFLHLLWMENPYIFFGWRTGFTLVFCSLQAVWLCTSLQSSLSPVICKMGIVSTYQCDYVD